MGIEYYVCCKDCKITRELDKFYTSDIYKVNNREDALSYSDRIKKDSFRAGLLVSFMAEHKGHDCTLFNEADRFSEEFDPYENEHGFTEDINFWQAHDLEDNKD